jgi:hypothetical protein
MYTLYCVNSLDESLVFPHVEEVRSIEEGYTVTVTESNKD